LAVSTLETLEISADLSGFKSPSSHSIDPALLGLFRQLWPVGLLAGANTRPALVDTHHAGHNDPFT